MEKTVERPERKKLLHERYKKTDLCIHCNQILASWEWEQECPARLRLDATATASLKTESSQEEEQ